MADYEDEAAAWTSEEEKLIWDEVEDCVLTRTESHEAIDDALRAWLDLTTKLRHCENDPQENVIYCVQMLLRGPLFQGNRDYVRTQIIYSLLQEDEIGPLYAIASLLLLDGHNDGSTFPMMVGESCFPRLLELVNGQKEGNSNGLHRLLLQLMYEMSRMERLKVDDLALVDDDFIHHLFRIIEGVSDDVHDPYHYPTIRVLLVLNEQYMLASTDSVTDTEGNTVPLTNRIVKCLSFHGPSFRTFGENIILLLNRETETSLQLLILKLLYLLFTNKATYEYFYTNDLRVLLDVIIRNLMDLPDEKMSLRHTYLRVLYPLVAHTQINQPPYHKQDEILRVLKILRGSQNAHFAPADETTLRLVDRVSKVSWLADADQGAGEAEVAKKLLGISLSRSVTESSVSVVDVAAVMEKPGVQTPSRNAADAQADTNGSPVVPDSPSATDESPSASPRTRAKKPLPALPKHRHGIPFSQMASAGQSHPSQVEQGGITKKVPPKAPPPRRLGKTRVTDVPTADPTSIPEIITPETAGQQA